MKRVSKKILSFFLMFLLVFSVIPAGASALGPGLEIAEADADPITTPPTKLEDGQVWTDKSVAYDDDGEFIVTLKAVGQNFSREEDVRESIDVVLVLDLSLSMNLGSPTRLSKVKTAAQNAVDIILNANSTGMDNRVALVTYSSMAQVELDFLQNATTIKNRIGNLSAIQSTNIQNAFLVSQELIEDRTDESRKPIIILLSDGAPTYYHTSFIDHGTYSNPSYRAGGGNPNNTSGTHVWQTVQQAMKAKTEVDNLDIYTIGFAVDIDGYGAFARATLMPTVGNMEDYLPGGATFNHEYWSEGSTIDGDADAAAVFQAFVDILNDYTSTNPLQYSEENERYEDVVITDTIGAGFELMDADNLPNGLDYDEETGVVTWTIPGNELKTMAPGSTSITLFNEVEFKVKLRDSATTGTTYETNDGAEASFKVAEDNPYNNDDPEEPSFRNEENTTVEGTDIIQNLPNTGWIRLQNTPSTMIKVTKEGPEGTVRTGESVEYTIIIKNIQDEDFDLVSVTDDFFVGYGNEGEDRDYTVSVIEYSVPGGAKESIEFDSDMIDPDTGTISFDSGIPLEPEEEVIITYTVTFHKADDYPNTAKAVAIFGDREISDEDNWDVRVKDPSNLDVIKKVNGGNEVTVRSGTTVTYTVKAKNIGNVTLERLSLEDEMFALPDFEIAGLVLLDEEDNPTDTSLTARHDEENPNVIHIYQQAAEVEPHAVPHSSRSEASRSRAVPEVAALVELGDEDDGDTGNDGGSNGDDDGDDNNDDGNDDTDGGDDGDGNDNGDANDDNDDGNDNGDADEGDDGDDEGNGNDNDDTNGGEDDNNDTNGNGNDGEGGNNGNGDNGNGQDEPELVGLQLEPGMSVLLTYTRVMTQDNVNIVIASAYEEGEDEPLTDEDSAKVNIRRRTPNPPTPPTPPTPPEPPAPPEPEPEDDGDILGDTDKDDDTGVAGDADKLPQTGGMSASTMLGLFGVLLAAGGGTAYIKFRRRNLAKAGN